ncbi:hypothetical protein NEOLEDRAFT_1087798 [Neolentinus lepideus HHB14362 ss-1]|uniref:RNase III domain-containing protein n=1 Tax=Neolentinus lepideus HHB14362 ss-1 TaxID=1314782 RepID=A0A165UGS1_9AGAM|nr:hypothetical protein NEOLEDRAFT_1087798 [Neolentinus lepideus HHB14362 ss-1]
MSLRASCVSLSRRALEKVPCGSSLAPARTVLVWRRHNHSDAAAAVKEEEVHRRPRSEGSSRSRPYAESKYRDDSPAESTTHLTEHLNEVFRPLEFPDELARRVLTHQHHRDSIKGHNARFAFMGRRVMDTFLMLFLDSVPPSVRSSNLDFDITTARILNTYLLGEYVAREWDIWRVMRWVPNIPRPAGRTSNRGMDGEDREVEQEEFRRQLATLEGAARDKLLRSVGLFKVAGFSVEAITGGIYHQFGGTVAHRIFHTRILPHLLLPGSAEGLRDSLHPHAMKICEQLGGLPNRTQAKPALSALDSTPESVEEHMPSSSDAHPDMMEAPSPRKVPLTTSRAPLRDSRKGTKVDPLVL